ncbi:MAG: GxxExxY protein [Candidatus Methanomethyliaceae archaeon]
MQSVKSVVQEFLYKDLTYAIIGAAMEVHRILGPGFLESVYEEALAHEFDLRSIPYERQAKLAVRYKEIIAGEFKADFLVDGKVVVELKAIKALTEGDEAQLLNYLKGTGYRAGLLLNFGAPSLEYKRRVL